MECVPSILSILLGAANCYSGCLLRPLHLWRLALRMSKPSGFKITLTIVHKSGVQENSGKEKGHHCNKEALHNVLQSTDLAGLVQLDGSLRHLLPTIRIFQFRTLQTVKIALPGSPRATSAGSLTTLPLLGCL